MLLAGPQAIMRVPQIQKISDEYVIKKRWLNMASDNRFFDYLINDHKIWKKIPQKDIIKMNTKTVRELRSIAKDNGLRGYYKLKKDDLVALLLE